MSPVREGSDPVRRRIAEAVLELVGRHGLSGVDVEVVCATAGVSRVKFERSFADLEDCVLSVLDELTAELFARVKGVSTRRGAWHDRVWATGVVAMTFLRERPLRARFMVAALNGSGPRALRRRDAIVSGIADVLDGAREDVGERGAMSRCTAEIAAGAVFATLQARIGDGSLDRGEEFLSELVYLAVMPYMGPEAAEGALAVQPLPSVRAV